MGANMSQFFNAILCPVEPVLPDLPHTIFGNGNWLQFGIRVDHDIGVRAYAKASRARPGTSVKCKV